MVAAGRAGAGRLLRCARCVGQRRPRCIFKCRLIEFSGDSAGWGPTVDGSGDGSIIPSVDASLGIAATMNDVSILFPLPSSGADIDNLLAPSATGSRGTLLPSALYASMGPITGSTEDLYPDVPEVGADYAAYDSLRVVAMRIDPCFASLDPNLDGGGCTAQIRLVFQQVIASEVATPFADAGTPIVFDSALHAFYDLSRTEFRALAQALVELRAANEDGAVLQWRGLLN
jgi:hypothetical protein